MAAKVHSLAADIEAVIDAVNTGTTRNALLVIRDRVGLGRAMSLLDTSKGGQTASQLDDLEALVQVANLHPEARTFESWLRGVLSQVPVADGVTVATIHRVKGMEWDNVLLASATGGILPHRLAEDVEEERRVLHVGLTRCRSRVVVLGDATRPSEFLAELDGTAPKHAAPRRRTVDTTPAPAPANKTDPAWLSPGAQRVFDALRTWRSARSKRDRVPAYVIASDATLREIAERRPASLPALSIVHGIGPTKLDLYGDEILELVDSTL